LHKVIFAKLGDDGGSYLEIRIAASRIFIVSKTGPASALPPQISLYFAAGAL
jgi:hypothetical protein